ncbi:hypothetical protein GGI07_004778 [Coemansia sp. Benny D115]|nr:hypothetical protein GGI07_004778 [Coemansia sp. Benny D115]
MDIREITDSSLLSDKHRAHHCGWHDCHKSFTRKSDLKRHFRIHTNEKPYSCTYASCAKRFVQKSALTVHLRTHSGEKPHCCKEPNCGKRFSDSSSLARHRHTHSGKRTYLCSFGGCNKQFYTKSAYSVHHRGHMDGLKPKESPSPTVSCPCTPVPAHESIKDNFDLVVAIPQLGVAERPGVHTHLFDSHMRYPTSTCRMARSHTASSESSSSAASDTFARSPSPIAAAILPPLHTYLGVLSKAASAQPPLPTTNAAAAQPRAMAHWPRYAPY